MYPTYRLRSKEQNLPLFLFLALFVFLSSLSYKEPRFALIGLPYLYILVSNAMYSISKRFKQKRAHFFSISLMFIFLFQAFFFYDIDYIAPKVEDWQEEFYGFFQGKENDQ